MAEVFINGAKVGTAAETNAQDAAIVASCALQHGCPPARIGEVGQFEGASGDAT
jgi:hypothetical protein